MMLAEQKGKATMAGAEQTRGRGGREEIRGMGQGLAGHCKEGGLRPKSRDLWLAAELGLKIGFLRGARVAQ